MMKWETIFDKYTDFISDYQDLIYWGFDYQTLQEVYATGDYSQPIREALFKVFETLSKSNNSFIKYRHFTVFMGDYGPKNRLFGVGILSSSSGKIIDIFSKYFKEITGYEYMGGSSIPWVPFLPVYRYEYGLIIEYMNDNDIAGKKVYDQEFGTGLKILYRWWESAEGLDSKQEYQG